MGKRNGKVNPQRKRVRFTVEFKLEAVRLLERGEKPAAQLALQLGVARNQLYKWQAQLQAKGKDQAFRGPGAMQRGGLPCELCGRRCCVGGVG
jgi:transposase